MDDERVQVAETGDRRGRTRRLFVISDLHLGGAPSSMMQRPQWLEEFVVGLPARLRSGENLELVIAGDFVDFLAIQPYADFTADHAAAVEKLRSTTDSGDFVGVFDALARHVAAGHRLTILLGNHDVELVLPAVQALLLRRLNATAHDVLFVDDGRAYRVGGALIEHGNAYDGANANDWAGLRHLSSAQSRLRAPDRPVAPSAGSQLVLEVVNDLKGRYPFVNLLQPEGEVLALLLLAFEPGLRSDFARLAKLFRARRQAASLPRPGLRSMAGHFPEAEPALDPDLLECFGDAYRSLVRPTVADAGAARSWLRAWVTPDHDSLSEIFKRGEPVPPKRLQQMRVALQKMLRDDRSDQLDGPAEQYGREAERILTSNGGIETVVMGHTHLPRLKRYGDGTYINTGTWIDRIRIPAAALDDQSGAELENFLSALMASGGVQALPPTFADLTVLSSGHVAAATLETFSRP